MDLSWSRRSQNFDWFTSCTGAFCYIIILRVKDNTDWVIDQFIDNNKVSQAMKRYVKLGYDVISGDGIELAVKGIAGVRISNLNPNRDNGK